MKAGNSEWQEALDIALASILRDTPGGITEYSLLQKLSNEPYSLFPSSLFSDNLHMFRAHFLLFNALYRLQKLYSDNSIAQLDIVATNITLNEWHGSCVVTDCGSHKLYDYYTDWSNYQETSSEDVDELIGSFWERFISSERKKHSKDEIDNAWTLFELDSQRSTKTVIKRRYHQLMHHHHPDKGGDSAYSQMLTHVYHVLLKSVH